jgi:hypothetical protein
MQNIGGDWLLVLFRDELSLALVENVSSGRFRSDGIDYVSPDENFLTAFYDRLIDVSGDLVGIRVHPATHGADELFGRLKARPYLGIQNGYLDLFLSAVERGHVESTGDQAFGGQVFSSPDGDIAISLDIKALCNSSEDVRAIKLSQAKWISIE